MAPCHNCSIAQQQRPQSTNHINSPHQTSKLPISQHNWAYGGDETSLIYGWTTPNPESTAPGNWVLDSVSYPCPDESDLFWQNDGGIHKIRKVFLNAEECITKCVTKCKILNVNKVADETIAVARKMIENWWRCDWKNVIQYWMWATNCHIFCESKVGFEWYLNWTAIQVVQASEIKYWP